MLYFCYYKTEDGEILGISKKELFDFKKTNHKDFLWIKDNLFRRKDCKIRMSYYGKDRKTYKETGFKRRVKTEGNRTSKWRGEAESLTHQIHVEAISELKEFSIKVNGKDVRLYIKSFETEKPVRCNNKNYEIDIFFELEKTEPAEYFEKFKGILYLEIYHTCPVDAEQAVDFAIENLPIYEYKVLDKYEISDSASGKEIEERINKIRDIISSKVLYGYPIYFPKEITDINWKTSENGNYYTYFQNARYTIYKKDSYYCICIDERNGKKPRFLEDFNDKKINDLDSAKMIVNYLTREKYEKDNK